MGRKKKVEVICENLELEIRTIFTTENILRALAEKDYERLSRFFMIARVKKLVNNPDMMYSLKQYLLNDLNVAKTSKAAFLHRNTLIYRIIKMQRITGIDVRNFTDAVLFNNIMFVRQFMEEHQVEITAHLEAKRQQLLQEQQGF